MTHLQQKEDASPNVCACYAHFIHCRPRRT